MSNMTTTPRKNSKRAAMDGIWFAGGNSWGGMLSVYPVTTATGRILIGVTNESGKQFCITVSRWINERKAGQIKEAK